MAAPFVALFLILSALVPGVLVNSKGFFLRVAKLGPCGLDDRRIVVIQVLSEGHLRINMDEVQRSDLGSTLEEIFRTRAERFALVSAEPDIPFSRVVDVVDIATGHAIQVALLPPLNMLLKPGARGDICPQLVLRHVDLSRTPAPIFPLWR